MNNYMLVLFVLIIAAAVAGGSFYLYWYQPKLEERDGLQREIDKLAGEKAKISGLRDEIQKTRDKIAEALDKKKKLAMESNQLSTVVPKLLDSTETVANKFDVKFNDIRISPIVRSEQWSEIPIEIGILGSFENIGKFLHVMEKRKISNLAAGSVTISVSAETDARTRSPMLTVTLNAKVYIMSGI